MSESVNPNRNLTQEFHVSDCYVWAQIYYLDSETNYRECLPENARRISPEPLVVLDDERKDARCRALSNVFLVLSVLMLFALLMLVLRDL